MLRPNLLALASATILECSTAGAVTIWGVDSNSAGSDRLVKFDSSNPAGTIVTVGATGVPNDFFISGLDFDASGTLWAVSQKLNATGSLYKIDPTTAHATLVGSLATPVEREITDLAYNPATDQLIGVAFDGQRDFYYTIDRDSGGASLVGEINSPGSIFLGICADSTGRVFLEDIGGQMRVLDGLNVVAMPAPVGAPCWFSQGMCMDWSNGEAWYLAATWQSVPNTANSRGDVRLIDNATGATLQILGAWPQTANNSYPIYAIGDVAVRPLPEAGAGLILCLTVLLPVRRVRSAPH